MVQPVSNPCYDIFAMPFIEGGYNIRDAFVGTKKVNLVAQNALPGAAPAAPEAELSLGRRVAAFAIGVILCIPIINMIAMAILRSDKSSFLHPEIAAPVPPAPPAPPVVPPAPPAPPVEPAVMLQRKQEAVARLDVIEAMVNAEADEAAKFERLAAQHFQPHPDIVGFDLDAFLDAKYPTNGAAITDLLAMRDWADVEHDGTWVNDAAGRAKLERIWGVPGGNPTPVTRDNYEQRRLAWFTARLEQYNNENPNDARYQVIRARLQNVLTYFTQERARVAPGSAEDTALKERYRTLYNNFIDATHNCVDQVVSQIETYAVLVAVQGNASQDIPRQERLFNQVAIALYKYRKELMTEILTMQDFARSQLIVTAVMDNDDDFALGLAIDAGFTLDEGYTEQQVRDLFAQCRNDAPGERVTRFQGLHMADWQRIAMRQLAVEQGLHGGLVNLQAGFNNNAQGRERVRLALEAFDNAYKPDEYILSGVANPPVGDEGDLRGAANNDLIQWTTEQYALDQEDPANPVLDARLALQGDGEFGAISMAGHFTAAGAALAMEAAGLIAPGARPVRPPRV